MTKLYFLKNYFLIFIVAYLVVLISKFIFLFYLSDSFNGIPFSSLCYAIFWGYKFDFATASLISLIGFLFASNRNYFAIASSFLLSFLFLSQSSDIMYFFESSRHMGYEVSDALTDASGLAMTAASQHTLLTISSLIFSVILFILIYKLLVKKSLVIPFNKFYLPKLLVILLFTLFFMRGMAQNIPLTPWQSSQIRDSKLATLALNGTYNAIFSLTNRDKKLKLLKIPTIDKDVMQSEMQKLYQNSYTPYNRPLHKPNVVIFFLESWSGVNIKNYGFNKSSISTTPFFDSILAQSIRPKAMIAGGHRTTEGIFATLCSFQNPLGKTVAKTQLQDFKYESLINIFNQAGYRSAFFQGSAKETSGTGAFAQSIGFQESYGKKDVIKRAYEQNNWGVHDSDLYNFTIDTIQTSNKPFIIGINGATTHDDKIPQGVEKINFVADKSLNNQLNALHFSDMALQKFVEIMKKKYPNTLFVFVADHCGGVKGSNFENYLIPFALYHKDLKPFYSNNYLSQRDIAPTILDAVFGDYKKITTKFSGRSLLSENDFFADYYHNGFLGWIEKDNLLEINTATNKHKCYDISTFTDREIGCTNDIINFKNRALSFTNASQKLLFDGKTKNFRQYKGKQSE